MKTTNYSTKRIAIRTKQTQVNNLQTKNSKQNPLVLLVTFIKSLFNKKHQYKRNFYAEHLEENN